MFCSESADSMQQARALCQTEERTLVNAQHSIETHHLCDASVCENGGQNARKSSAQFKWVHLCVWMVQYNERPLLNGKMRCDFAKRNETLFSWQNYIRCVSARWDFRLKNRDSETSVERIVLFSFFVYVYTKK